MNGLEGIIEFWYHTTRDNAFGGELAELLFVDRRDDATVIIGIAKNTSLLKAERQGDIVMHRQSTCHRGGNRVGIGIENMPIAIVRERSNYRHGTALYEMYEKFGIDAVNIAHKAEIDHLLRAVVHLDSFQRPFMTAYHIAVHSGQADGTHALCLQTRHNILVD